MPLIRFFRGIFLSTLSLRRATAERHASSQQEKFLSTLSLRRATNDLVTSCQAKRISIHALLAESDPLRHSGHPEPGGFLSTLSLRRATDCLGVVVGASQYFYPRSPCGERLDVTAVYGTCRTISIHALLAESDPELDTLADKPPFISIHALLAESDT